MAMVAADWPPQLPDASGFVAPDVPGAAAAIRSFMTALRADPAGGLRCTGRAIWMLGLGLVLVPMNGLWRRLGLGPVWSRLFLAGCARACGIRVTAHGTPHPAPVFLVANHLSWTDALILGGRTGTAFVAQDGIADWPLLGWLCRCNDTVFVSRGNRLGVGEQIAAMRGVFAASSRLALFPEGTTSDGRRLLPFKAPLFAMLMPPPSGATLMPPPSGSMVQPVVIDADEAGRDLAWVGMETGARNAWRLMARPGTWHVRVHFLPPINPADFADRKALARETRARIAAKLSETLGGRPVH